MAWGAIAGAAGGAASSSGSSGGIGQLIFGTASAGASGGNQNAEDPFAGGILSRIGGWTADPQTFFSLPRKIRNAKRDERMKDQQLELGGLQIEASKLALGEEKRKLEWNSELRKLLYGGKR